MIETYHTEVTKKRQNARWFWIIVFLFALFLYFFFQGYYPDVRLGFKRIFSEGNTGTASGNFEDLIRSFGIINVKTIPTTATMRIGSGLYANNEKRMTNYGEYTMNITNIGYHENTLSFSIDKEKPYFIEEITLLPIPKYFIANGIDTVYQVDKNIYLVKTASGLIASGSVSHTGIITKNLGLRHIGGVYFQSGSLLYEWQGEKLSRSNSERENFVNTCPKVEWIHNNSLYCPGVRSIYTESSLYMTGIADIYHGLIRTQSGNTVDIYRGYTRVSGSYSGRLQDIHTIDNEYYISSGGLLSPIRSGGELIPTPLDTISLARTLSTEMVIIGKKEGKTLLLVRHRKDSLDRIKTVELPNNLEYSDVEFIESEGNIFIRTPKALLFVYRGSDEVIWIIDSTILAVYDGGALYTEDDNVWQVSWNSQN